MSDAIAVEGLTKSYGSTRGVIDLTFSVGPGEVFGYLGPNGAGKTTTIRTLLDFIRPTRGTATVLGLDSRREASRSTGRTGYLPGEARLVRTVDRRASTSITWPSSGAGSTGGWSPGLPNAWTATSR